MKKPIRPGVLAVRAVNQYRRREVLAYLALRYYLENSATRTDIWAKYVATDLVLTRTNTPYFLAQHFKEITESGDVHHRAIFLPSANEALAEAALLAECASHPGFSNPESVYSYQLNESDDRSGIFQHYTKGLRNRHLAIAQACEGSPDGIVLYTDIKCFYPSISLDLALSAWRKKCDQTRLAPQYREVGEKIINDHAIAGDQEHKSILTGPMFSHLIGNLVLADLDAESRRLPAKYFRYVDDITLVGSREEVEQSLQTIRCKIEDMDFKLHEKESSKNIEVSTQEWLKGRHDFQPSKNSFSWMTLVGDLKRFLLTNPDQRLVLKHAFQSEDFRIPIKDYSEAIFEAGFLERFGYWAKKPWFKRKVASVSIESLLNQARWLRKHYEVEFRELIEHAANQEGFERKRCIPKLRYRLGRLVYLGTEDTLSSLHPFASEIPELAFHAAIMNSVATANIDQVLNLGTNAAQAAAQLIKASGKSVNMTVSNLSITTEQSLAIFLLNGVSVQRNIDKDNSSELIRFAETGADINMMKSQDAFMREIACLHGIAEIPRHSSLLDSVFDVDEDLAMDAIEQLQQSLPS